MDVDRQAQLRQVIESAGGAEQFLAEMRQFEADGDLLSERYADFLREFPGQWIAIYEGRVRASSEHLEDLLKRLAGDGVPRGKAVVEYMDCTDRLLIV